MSTSSVDALRKCPFTLLLVEDDAQLRFLLRLALADEPYTIYEAATGEMALAMAFALTPDLILLDINLPGLDGISVLQQIRQVNQTVRILIVSAVNARQWRHMTLTHGANGFVAKPFNLLTLRQMMAQQLQEGAS